MNEGTLKKLIIIICLVVLSYVAWKQIFKIAGLTMESVKPFMYVGKTPKQDWYNWITPLAQKVGADYGIPWQAIAVQTALETGWGKSSSFSKYNNFGGIKSKGSNSVGMVTKEFVDGKMITITDGFKTWKTPYEGLIGYVEFFHKNPRYKAALNYPRDANQFIIAVAEAGYATDPNYASKLTKLLKDLA
jgi:flagellum-specific peptidoglycan hydrolase FlgJ